MYLNSLLNFVISVKVWFFDPSRDERSSMFNSLVARLGEHPFCHCEVQFPDGVAFTVYMGTKVIKRERNFDTVCYKCIDIPCSIKNQRCARMFAEQRHRDGQNFSMMSMIGSFVPMPGSATSAGTFCSKLCCEILQSGGMLACTIDANSTTPSSLYSHLYQESGAKYNPNSSGHEPIDFRNDL